MERTRRAILPGLDCGLIMRPLDTLERWLRPVAVPYLAPVLAAAQVTVFIWVVVAAPNNPGQVLDPMALVPERVLAGEWWRLFSYLLMPPSSHPIWAIISWYLLVMAGSSLEREWGPARFNLYFLLGWFSTSAAAFADPSSATTNQFILLSIFLAYCTLAPEAIFQIFFVLPVKAKWLAWVTWALLAFRFMVGSWAERLAVLATVTNWAAFFLPMVIARLRSRTGRAARRAVPAALEPFHRCIVCGRTDRSHPDLEFRYCGECDGAPGYCLEHLRNHQHIRQTAEADARSAAASR